MDAPDWRWLGLNQQNCALTVIVYRTGMPGALVSYNDAGHLPPELRWTGFPAGLRPATVTGMMTVGLAAAPVFPLLTLTTARRMGVTSVSGSSRTVSLQVAASAIGGTALPAGIGQGGELPDVGLVGEDQRCRGSLREGLERVGCDDHLVTGPPVGDDSADEEEGAHGNQFGRRHVSDVAGRASDPQHRERIATKEAADPATEMMLHATSSRKLRLRSAPRSRTLLTPELSIGS